MLVRLRDEVAPRRAASVRAATHRLAATLLVSAGLAVGCGSSGGADDGGVRTDGGVRDATFDAWTFDVGVDANGDASGDAGGVGDAGSRDANATGFDAGPVDESERRPGGDTTTSVLGVGAFVQPAANLSLLRRSDFEAGLQFFQLDWVPAPGSPRNRTASDRPSMRLPA